MFLLQILVNNLVTSHQTSTNLRKVKAISPTINFKIHEGPTISIPYLSNKGMHKFKKAQEIGYNHPPIEVEEALIRGIYNFDKGKSCLFTLHYEDDPKIKFQIEVIDGLVFPSKVFGHSCAIERTLKSSKTRTVFKENLIIYDNKEEEFGTISLILKMEEINSKHCLGSNNLIFGTEKNYPMKHRSRTFVDNASQSEINISQYFKKSFKQSSKSERRNSVTGNFNNLEENDTIKTSKVIKNKFTKNKYFREKPTGWLRSTPVYKNKIHTKISPFFSTRTSLLRLYETYPDIKYQVNSEVERQLRKKGKLIENILKERHRNTSKFVTKTLPSIHNNYKSDKNLQTEIDIISRNKKTSTGDSLIDQASPKYYEEIKVQNANFSSTYSPTFNESIEEFIESNKGQSKSSQISGSNSVKSYLVDGNKLSYESGKDHNKYAIEKQEMKNESRETTEVTYEDAQDSSYHKSNGKSKTSTSEEEEEEAEEVREKTSNSRKNISIETDKKIEEEEEEVPSLNYDPNSYLQKSVERQLLKQSSKTSSSIYPQSSEEKAQMSKRLTTVPKRFPSEDREESISDLSERIANILKPKTEIMPSVHTDSISSFLPSNLSDAYSSLSDL